MPEDMRQHTVFVADPIWAEAERRARAQYGRDGVSGALRAFLAWYTEQPGAKMPRRPQLESVHEPASA